MITKNLPSGFVIQSIVLSKDAFPLLEDAVQWVKGAEGDTSDIDVENIMHKNWIGFLRKAWVAEIKN